MEKIFHINIDYTLREPIGPHWFGDYDEIKLPAIQDHYNVYNVISIDTGQLPVPLWFKCPFRRLYFPHYFNSDFDIDDQFFEYKPDGEITIYGDFPTTIYSTFYDGMDHRARNVSFRQAQEFVLAPDWEWENPRHFFGSIPVGAYYQGTFDLKCPKCGEQMKMVLQVESDNELNLTIYDGYTVFYGWCERCNILGATEHNN